MKVMKTTSDMSLITKIKKELEIRQFEEPYVAGINYSLGVIERLEKESEPDALFLAFYNAYPRKVGKPNALKAWKKFKVDAELAAKIMASLEAHKQTRQWQNKEYIPHPATWLNQERWEDEVDSETVNRNPKYDGI